jgi:hypothetical protein
MDSWPINNAQNWAVPVGPSRSTGSEERERREVKRSSFHDMPCLRVCECGGMAEGEMLQSILLLICGSVTSYDIIYINGSLVHCLDEESRSSG